MKQTSFANWPCSIARTVDLVRDGWAMLVLRDAIYGITKFDEFQRELGIPRNTLTERLNRLVDQGLLHKRPYQHEPVRYDYVLTEKGRDFFGVLAAMSRWGDQWLAGTDGAPVVFHHESCGHDSHAEVVCATCRAPLRTEDTTMKMGPGYPKKLRSRPDVQRRFARN
ncbi:helix-turn-helix domain-containing protein [Mycobacterium sp. 852002-10029_SCH5224772]|uniref:winged helix-turn-helix transcriptional regulator n=1 Tax=Mycobacterium sp. 852002-10029_SCH5224772 TaxID=1834083 RepID=UPI0007FEA822|nr:helix-turn-helix domain-containing protein [Mycobacterium sp. 852002-10029_SCH5224772]OBE97127.1 HxlR family transcriptional regulator [Mycobacterium sp. 852002-10029_SCH5224772]